MCKTNSTPFNVVTESSPSNDLSDAYYDITIIICIGGLVTTLDNTVDDWTDYVDCDTVSVKHIKVRV